MPLTEKDRLLVNELLSGDSRSWSTFVDRYANLITHVIRHAAHAHSLKLQPEDVEDLTAEVFATLLERNMAAIRGFRGRSSFATYLTVVVRRITLKMLTQRRYMQAFGHFQAAQSHVDEAAGNPGKTIERRDEVDSLMSRLPAALQPVARLFYLDQLSYLEISRRLQMPVNSIGPTLSRIREQLTASRSRPEA